MAEAGRAEAGERVRLLRAALAEWRGPPFQELAYESFLQGEIRRLEELYVGAQEQLLDGELELGHHGQVVPTVEALIRQHPYRERLRAQLMLALYRSGRQAEALQAYQDARRSLAELGLEPGHQLRRLHGAILRQEAGIAPAAEAEVRTGADHLADVVDALLAGRLVPVLAPTLDLAPQLAARFRYRPATRSKRRASPSTRRRCAATARCTTSCATSRKRLPSRRPCTGSSRRCRRSCAPAAGRTSCS